MLPLDPRDFDGNDNGLLRLQGGINNPGHLAGRLTSVLPDCREPLRAFANDAAVTGDEPEATVKLNRRRHGVPGVILTGRATNVPFTAVLTGPERTTTDNTTTAATCTHHRFPR